MQPPLSPPRRTRCLRVRRAWTLLEVRAVGGGDNAVDVEVRVRGEVVHLDVFDICRRLHRGLLVHLFV